MEWIMGGRQTLEVSVLLGATVYIAKRVSRRGPNRERYALAVVLRAELFEEGVQLWRGC